ncbi:MAG: methyl-accepting chemotaxis protein [Leptospiraceae bacterium]|nr:methyl-accepting chemotaxis protein [Leptospiraceae bacterium]
MNQANQRLTSEKEFSLKVISSFCTVAGIIWSSLYAYFDLGLAIYPPLGFSAIVGISLLLNRIFQWQKQLVFTQIFMILITPVFLQWSLGGFHKSGVVMLWSILAPFGGVIFQNSKKAIGWIIAFEILLFISLYFDSNFSKMQTKEISTQVNTFFYGMNIIGVSTVILISINYYNNLITKDIENREAYLNLLNMQVDKLLSSINMLSHGDLTGNLEKKTDDPIFVKLIDGFNQGIYLMKTLLQDLGSSSKDAIITIQNISNKLTKLETEIQNFTSQCQSMEGSIVSFQKVIRQMDEFLHRSSELSNQSMQKASDGEKVLSVTMQKINEVTTSFNISVEIVKELEKISSEIGEVTNVINEISESTNLLSLNASIEAARAGENGKGFSVVAKEIGKLTNSTNEATQKIEKKVKEIKKKTKEAATQFTDSHSLVKDSVEKISQLKGNIEKIIDSIENSNDNNLSISKILNKEIDEIKIVSSQILEIVTSFKHISNEVQSLYQSSKLMNAQSDQMYSKLEQFKVS